MPGRRSSGLVDVVFNSEALQRRPTMFFRIPRLTPGYIRYLQTQAAQAVVQSRAAPVMPRMAVLLGFVGLGMSGYSSRQLTLNHKPSTHLFR